MSKILVAPIEALTDNTITETERRVLLILFSFRDKATNTVWPSTVSIAEMANIADVPRVSKITSSLAEKGWLTKKKRGFSGCNEYALTVPERLNIDANLANSTNLVNETNLAGDFEEENTKLANSAKLAENNNTNLANFTKSNLANSAKYKEQTNDQTIEQTSSKKINKKNTGMKTMKTWLNELQESGEKAIPDDDPIFEYAVDSQIPYDWLRLVWIEFRAEFSEKNKRQIDWRAHFRNFVRKNYYKLWWLDQGAYKLTSRGEQAMIAMNNRDRREST